MGWTNPRTWTPGELVTALMMNQHVRDNLNLLKTCIGNDGLFKGYRETKQTVAISGGTLAVDYTVGNHVDVTLNANITTLTLSNVPAGCAAMLVLYFTADGTGRTITWPASVKWGNPGAPTMTSTNGKIDVVTLLSLDGGTSWLGSYQQNY